MFTRPENYIAGALNDIITSMDARAVTAGAKVNKAGARHFIVDREKLRTLVAGLTHDVGDLLELCEYRISCEVERRSHWTFDMNRLRALRQARLALRYLRRFELRLAEAA